MKFCDYLIRPCKGLNSSLLVIFYEFPKRGMYFFMADVNSIRKELFDKIHQLESLLAPYEGNPKVSDFTSTEAAKRFREKVKKLNRDIKRLEREKKQEQKMNLWPEREGQDLQF